MWKLFLAKIIMRIPSRTVFSHPFLDAGMKSFGCPWADCRFSWVGCRDHHAAMILKRTVIPPFVPLCPSTRCDWALQTPAALASTERVFCIFDTQGTLTRVGALMGRFCSVPTANAKLQLLPKGCHLSCSAKIPSRCLVERDCHAQENAVVSRWQ